MIKIMKPWTSFFRASLFLIILVSCCTTSCTSSSVTSLAEEHHHHQLPPPIGSTNDDDISAFEPLNDFPVPSVQNVYKEWKPVDGGHPFRDPTLFYAPPRLERLPLDVEQRGRRMRRRRRNQRGRARSQENDFFSLNPGIVVRAQTNDKDAMNYGYSIYGSPYINYSKLYGKSSKVEDSEVKYPRRLGGGFQYMKKPLASKTLYNSQPSNYLSSRKSRIVDKVYELGQTQVSTENDLQVSASQENRKSIIPSFINNDKVIYRTNSFSHRPKYLNNHEKRFEKSKFAIPITDNHSPPMRKTSKYSKLSHQQIVGGQIHHVYHDGNIPLKHKTTFTNSFDQSKYLPKFPLGSPLEYVGLVKKARKLEGIPGPAPPKTPQPSSINLIEERWKASPNGGHRNAAFKRVRDMQYYQPESIMRVKESGELYFLRKNIDTSNWLPVGEKNTLFNYSFSSLPVKDIVHQPISPVVPQLTEKIVILTDGDNSSNGKIEDNEYEEKGNVYHLCIQEVPTHIQNTLCDRFKNKSKASNNVNVSIRPYSIYSLTTSNGTFNKTEEQIHVIHSHSKVKKYGKTNNIKDDNDNDDNQDQVALVDLDDENTPSTNKKTKSKHSTLGQYLSFFSNLFKRRIREKDNQQTKVRDTFAITAR